MSEPLAQAADLLPDPPAQAATVYDAAGLPGVNLAQHMLLCVADDLPPLACFAGFSGIQVIPGPSAPYAATANLLAQTPNIDRLGSTGIRLTSVRVSPVCSPTRATLWTGVYPFRHGEGDVVNKNVLQAKDLAEFGDPGFIYPSIFTALEAANVRTAFIGKCHQSFPYDETLWSDPSRLGQGWQILEKIVAPSTYVSATLRNLNQTQGPNGPTVQAGSYYNFCLNTDDQTGSGRLNGHEVRINDGRYNTSVLIDNAITWWQSIGPSDRAFMYLALNATHTPFGNVDPETARDFPPDALVATQEYKDRRDEEAAITNPGDAPKSYWEDQMAATEAIDVEFQRLLDNIPPAVRARTTVVFIADNGPDGVSLPGAFYWGKDYGTEWNRLIKDEDNKSYLKGTLYHFAARVDAIWNGPAGASLYIPRSGQLLDLQIDGPDFAATIAEYFGATFGPNDGVSFLHDLWDGTATNVTRARQDQYAEVFAPNGHWTDLTVPDDTEELRQSMWSWLRAADGWSPAGRFSLIRTMDAGVWRYLLFHHYLEDGTPVDPYERVSLANDVAYSGHLAEIEQRIVDLLNSGLGTGSQIEIEDVAGSIFVQTDSNNAIPIEDVAGTLQIYPTTTGTIGMPVEDPVLDLVIPYVNASDSADWSLTIELASGPPAGSFDLTVLLDAGDNLVIEDPAGDLLVPSNPGSPNTLTIEDVAGALTVDLVAVP